MTTIVISIAGNTEEPVRKYEKAAHAADEFVI
jgi:hypothetical protein